jgi:release factor glutamine methyltransferase
MQSVLEVLKKSEAFFEKAGLESPKVNAEWLVAETLGCKRLDLFLQFDKPLEESVLSVLRERIQRRARGEPLEYILGNVEFHEIRLNVAPGVLVPRKETELLVDHVISRLDGVESPRIVDLGTGSGAIALALANSLPNAKVLAVERSKDALVQAKANADTLGLRDRVSFRSGNWLEGLSFEADCIVSNPPYLTVEEWESAQTDVRVHEPKEALVAAEAGLADLRVIVTEAYARLAPGGLLALEMGVAHGDALKSLATEVGYVDATVETDDAGRDRFFFASKK